MADRGRLSQCSRWLRVPGLRPVSGEATIKILTKEYGFAVSGQSGSHIRLSKQTPEGKVGTVVPLHRELKIGTLRGVLRLAKIDPDDFARHL
ncbi:type II toxin-antitoxin system HicA family toxin [Methanoculleus bourgensis]|uniref:type II toxin-antitoxin system HicA family toxin n=1 Tax=Methanoculleus bourgensis TaxID=83986 RepID=UPI0009EE69D5